LFYTVLKALYNKKRKKFFERASTLICLWFLELNSI